MYKIHIQAQAQIRAQIRFAIRDPEITATKPFQNKPYSLLSLSPFSLPLRFCCLTS